MMVVISSCVMLVLGLLAGSNSTGFKDFITRIGSVIVAYVVGVCTTLAAMGVI